MYKTNPFTTVKTCHRCKNDFPLVCFGLRESDGRVTAYCKNCARIYHLFQRMAWCGVCSSWQERRLHFNRYNDVGELVPSPMCQACHREHSVPVGSDASEVSA